MSDATQPILKAEHLGITFGGLKAVSNFNMTINKGELIGLIGPNGAGKTTVFNLLTGVYKPTEGEFWLDGTRMNGKKTYQVVRAGIARTFQNIRLFKQLTVEENVLVAFDESFTYHMGSAIFRTPGFWKQENEMHEKAIDLLRIFNLEHDMSLVMSVCQRIQVLDYGRTIASGTPEEIANNPQVISAYLGSDNNDDADGDSTTKAEPEPSIAKTLTEGAR